MNDADIIMLSSRAIESEKRRRRVYGLGVVACLLAYMPMAAVTQSIPLLIVGTVAAVGLLICLLLLDMRICSLSEERSNAAERCFWRLSKERRQRALYGNGLSDRFYQRIVDEITCQDVHMPGDCPLCGAK